MRRTFAQEPLNEFEQVAADFVHIHADNTRLRFVKVSAQAVIVQRVFFKNRGIERRLVKCLNSQPRTARFQIVCANYRNGIFHFQIFYPPLLDRLNKSLFAQGFKKIADSVFVLPDGV